MSDGPKATPDSGEHWFAGRDVDVLIYRVNRRPLGPESLFDQRPGNVLEHIDRVLHDLQPVRSGRRYQREWRVGNLATDPDSGSMTGILGWSRTDETLSNFYDQERQAWIDRLELQDASAVAPFAFIVGPSVTLAPSLADEGASDRLSSRRTSEARYLGVLRHPSFAEGTVAHVLTEMLNRGEHAQLAPTVTWAVEPVGDKDEFFAWLEATEVVTELQFVFKRPNPDGEPEFQEMFERLDRLKADKIRENVTARDPEVGLDKAGVLSDPTSMAFIAAAMAAFGFLVGKGKKRGKAVRYDQRQKALRQRVDDVGTQWDAATEQVLGAVRAAAERRRRDG